MRPTLLALTFVLTAWSLHVQAERPRQDAAPDPAWRVLSYAGTSPSFIPEVVLAAKPVVEQGLPDSVLSGILGLRANARAPVCQFRAQPSPPGLWSSWSLQEAIASEPTAFVGTVKRIVPGVSNWELFVGRAVYLDVEAILHGDYAPPHETAVIVIPGGTILIDGTPVCTPPDEGSHQPLIGDRLVVAGVASEFDPTFFQHVYVFPIMGEEVLPVPSPSIAPDAQPIPVVELLEKPREEIEK